MLRIPEGHRRLLARILDYSENELASFIAALKNTTPAINPRGLGKQISRDCLIPESEVDDILEVLFGVYSLLNDKNETETGVAESVVDAAKLLKESAGKEESKFDVLKSFLADSLRCHDVLGVSSRASRIMSEHENVLLDVEVFTDFRPVFNANLPPDKITAGVIVHSLKINYRHKRHMEEKFFAMDFSDIELLKSALDRAIVKHGVLKGVIDDKGITVLDEEE